MKLINSGISFLRFKGTLNSKEYIAVLACYITFSIFQTMLRFRSDFFSYISEQSSSKLSGLLGLLDLFSGGYETSGLNLIPIRFILQFVFTYILFVATVKRCKDINISMWKGYLMAIIVCVAINNIGFIYKFLKSVIYLTSDFNVEALFFILLSVAGTVIVIYLCRIDNDNTARNNIYRSAIMLLTACIVYDIVRFGLDIIANYIFNIVWLSAFFIICFYIISKYYKEQKLDIPLSPWLILAIFLIVEIASVLLIYNKILSGTPAILANTLTELCEAAMLVYCSILMIPILNNGKAEETQYNAQPITE